MATEKRKVGRPRHKRVDIDGKEEQIKLTPEEEQEIAQMPKEKQIQIFKQKVNISKFLKRVAAGQNKIAAFREIFPEAEEWSHQKIWRHVNTILLRNTSSKYLKLYRNKWLEMLEQKKVDMLLYIEQEIIFSEDKRIRPLEKLKAIETFSKLAGFMAPTPQLIQQINVKEDTQKELMNIFGIEQNAEEPLTINNAEVVDAEMITDDIDIEDVDDEQNI